MKHQHAMGIAKWKVVLGAIALIGLSATLSQSPVLKSKAVGLVLHMREAPVSGGVCYLAVSVLITVSGKSSFAAPIRPPRIARSTACEVRREVGLGKQPTSRQKMCENLLKCAPYFCLCDAVGIPFSLHDLGVATVYPFWV